jgi:Na+-transporting NADH:ubiquinone oxidoreductase subunit C
MKKGLLYTVIFMFLISFSFVFLLALGNELTRVRTEHNSVIAFRKAVLNVFHVPFKDNDEAYSLFDVLVVEKKAGVLYAYNKGETPLYAVVFRGSGLWGTIEGVLSVNFDLTRIIGLEIVDQNETPGLGGRIGEKAFRDQFEGERIGGGDSISMTQKGIYDYDHENSTIDVISGATQTSQRLQMIINDTIQGLRKILGENDGSE